MSSSKEVYDYSAGKYVRWSTSRQRWLDSAGRTVSAPQRTPTVVPVPTSPSPPPTTSSRAVPVPRARESSTDVDASAAATGAMRSLNIGSPPTQSKLSEAASMQKAQQIPKQASNTLSNVQYAPPLSASRGGQQTSQSASTGQPSIPQAPALPNQRSIVQASGSSAQSNVTQTRAAYNATLSDQKTGIRTRWEVSETTQYNDPKNANSNRTLNVKRIRQFEPQTATASEKRARDFRNGRVIEVLLVPPEDVETSNVSRITPTDTGEVRKRRFVIVREFPDRNAFEALAVKTYNGRGVAGPGAIKSHHSMIYTSPARQPTTQELPGRNENGMQPVPIRVVPYDRGKALDPMSRLDYADRYEFDLGVGNIRLFGRVHEDSLAALFLQYHSVWSSIALAVRGQTSASSSTAPTATGGVDLDPPATPGYAASGSSTVAHAGSSRHGTAGSTASGMTANEMAAAQNLLQRYALANSGQCTEQQVQTILLYLQEYARRQDLPEPARTISSERIRNLARNAQARSEYIQQIKARWDEAEQKRYAADPPDGGE